MTDYPPDWDVAELGNIGFWLSGGTPSTSNPGYWDGHIPWISATSLKSFDIRESERKVTELGANSGTRRVPAGTVIFVVRGMSLKTEFRVGVTSREMTFGQDCKAIQAPVGVNSRFLAYALKANEGEVLAMVDEAGHGTGRLPTHQLARLKIGLPQEAEQKQILEVLDSADESIRSTERLIATLEQLREALLRDLLKNGVDERGMLRDPRRNKAQFVDTEIGLVPECWSIGPLGLYVTLQRGFDITVAHQRSGSVPVVSSSGVTSFHDSSMVCGPGVVIGRKGKLGGVYYVEEDFWPHDTSLWVKDFHGNNVKFVAYLLRCMRLERFDAATSVPTLNRNIVHPVVVAFPSAVEQARIVKRLEVLERPLLRQAYELFKLRKIKQGLTEDLLTGRARVSAA